MAHVSAHLMRESHGSSWLLLSTDDCADPFSNDHASSTFSLGDQFLLTTAQDALLELTGVGQAAEQPGENGFDTIWSGSFDFRSDGDIVHLDFGHFAQETKGQPRGMENAESGSS